MAQEQLSTTRRSAAAAGVAHALLAAQGARATRARIAVLCVLLSAREALTHHDVERRLPRGHDVDRVTLYRVLEWLTAHGFAHKVACEDRVSRYSGAGHEHAGTAAHMHFQCSDCGRVICLDSARMPMVSLPPGFRRHEVEVTIKGCCAACAR